jgi:hypothetical protein
LLEDGILSSKTEKTTKTRDNSGSSTKLQRLFNPFMTTRDPWTSEVETLMHTPLILDGTNSSSMIKDGLSMKRVRFLEFRANLITRIDNVSRKIETTRKSLNSGIFYTLMLPSLFLHQDTAKSGECGSIDLSIFRLK